MMVGKVQISLTVILLILTMVFSGFSVQTFADANTTKVTIHYQEAANNKKEWGLWIWSEGGEGKAYPFTSEDEFGKIAEIEVPRDAKRVGFIVRTESWEKDGEEDRWMDVSGGEVEVWVK